MKMLIQPQKKNRNYSLDLLKLISAFMVVFIHFRSFGALGKFIVVIARFAVPVFFMISGYFSYYDDRGKIKHKILRIVKLYITAFFFYFCFNVFVKVFAGQYSEAIWYVSTYLRIRYVAPTVLFNESNTAIHLWFLGSLIYSYLIHYFIIGSKIKDNAIYVLSCVLIGVHLALGIGLSVFGIQAPSFLLKNYVLRNFLFMGYPLFAFGQLIRKKEDVILNNIRTWHIAVLIIIGVTESVVMFGIDWRKELYIGSIMLAFAFFVLTLKAKNKTYPSWMINLFETSTAVYLIHVMIGDILSMTYLEKIPVYLFLKPIIIFAVSVMTAWVINRALLLKRNRFENTGENVK